MNFKDKSVRDAIDRLKHQYQIFTSNQFIIYYLNEAGIPKNDWIDIEDLIDSNKYYEGEGYDLDQLYEQILTFSRFVVKLKKEILPKINSDAQKRIARLSADNKVLYKMTVDNAPGNVKVFYDIIIDLFIKIKKIDEKRSGEGKMLYDKRSYLKEIEKNLDA
jgi:hypothetical protein